MIAVINNNITDLCEQCFLPFRIILPSYSIFDISIFKFYNQDNLIDVGKVFIDLV
jgi:hypothetical protein